MKRSVLFISFLAVACAGLVFAQVSQDPVIVAKKAVSLSNVKQLCLGIIMYENDYDDYVPYVKSVKTLKSVVAPYLKTDKLWDDPNPAGGQYLFNMCLGGVIQAEVPQPATTPLIYESKPWSDGHRAVGFFDGHAKFVTEEVWKTYADNLKLHLKKKGKPITP